MSARRLMLLAVPVILATITVTPPVEVEAADEVVYPMIFPIAGPIRSIQNTFGAPRSGGRTHQGVDIMAAQMTPVVAVADGIVEWVGSPCCSLSIRHDDGWGSAYVHLNNDTGLDTFDNTGWGIAPGIERGSRVNAGQLIGWVGDSGNAPTGVYHLHFELWPVGARWGSAIDPYPSLIAAPRLSAPGESIEPPCREGEVCDTVAFQDAGSKFHLWHTISAPRDVTAFFFGNPGDVAFSGDWNCDGVDTPGLYRRSDGYVYLRNSNSQGVADISFFFGNPGDYPVAGDFNGNGCDTVSIYRPSQARFYIVNQLGSNDGGLGAAEYGFDFGGIGDKPFVGDFDGDGVDTVGLHRESTGLVYFRNSNTTGVADIQFVFGNPRDKIIAGDWNGSGSDSVGVYRPSSGMFYMRFTNTQGPADASIFAGPYVDVVTIRR